MPKECRETWSERSYIQPDMNQILWKNFPVCIALMVSFCNCCESFTLLPRDYKYILNESGG
jgi:hypothetical protein